MKMAGAWAANLTALLTLMSAFDLPLETRADDCPLSVDMAEVWEFYTSCVAGEGLAKIEQELEEESMIASNLPEQSGPAFTAARFLGNSITGKQKEVIGKIMLECLEKIKVEFGLSKCEMEQVIKNLELSAMNLAGNADWQSAITSDFLITLLEYSPCIFEFQREFLFCSGDVITTRSVDGTCNNLDNPEWGSALRPFVRLLPADYGDGIGSPRRATDGSELPSARLVSRVIHTSPEGFQADDFLTLMHMTFGQILDHDTDRSAIAKLAKISDEGTMMGLVDVECGDDGCNTTGVEHQNCFPIRIAPDDPDFTDKSCLQFVRSQGVIRHDCRPGPREQLNQISSILDLSQVYGSTLDENKFVRDTGDPSRGRLITTPNPFNAKFKHLMPTADVKDCRGTTEDVKCFKAGDSRVNEQIGLMTLHTIFVRAHNTIEEELHQLNPQWQGERLYQEARKILIAAWQFIVYQEYLPPLLGPQLMETYKLKVQSSGGHVNVYDDTVNPDVSNVFATAAFRFGHTQIQNGLLMTSHAYDVRADPPLSTVLFEPTLLYQSPLPSAAGPDCIALGMCTQRGQVPERFFPREMQVNLFSDDPPKKPGSDLAALDIQRGRDHGMPSYNRWREYCGLSVAQDFDDLVDIDEDTQDMFRQVYNHIDDVELFPAAMSEKHVPMGSVGPTFACLLGEDFHKLRVGDRFWFENGPSQSGFTEDQLNEIRRMTFARILCDNCDHVDTIQKYVMLVPFEEATDAPSIKDLADFYDLTKLYYGDENRRVPCSEIPKMDLSLWAES